MTFCARLDEGGGMPSKTEKARRRHSTAFQGNWQTLGGSAADSCQDRGGDVTVSWARHSGQGEAAVCRAGPRRRGDGIPAGETKEAGKVAR